MNLNDTAAPATTGAPAIPAASVPTATGNASTAAAVAGATHGPGPGAKALVDSKGNPTDYQIAKWAQERGRKIKVVEVGDKLVCFVHPPRPIVEAANDVLLKTKKASKYAEVIMSNCQLNYVKETADDDELFYALCGKIDEIITGQVAILKN